MYIHRKALVSLHIFKQDYEHLFLDYQEKGNRLLRYPIFIKVTGQAEKQLTNQTHPKCNIVTLQCDETLEWHFFNVAPKNTQLLYNCCSSQLKITQTGSQVPKCPPAKVPNMMKFHSNVITWWNPLKTYKWWWFSYCSIRWTKQSVYLEALTINKCGSNVVQRRMYIPNTSP